MRRNNSKGTPEHSRVQDDGEVLRVKGKRLRPGAFSESALKSSWAEQLGVIRAWADSLAHTRKGLGLG